MFITQKYVWNLETLVLNIYMNAVSSEMALSDWCCIVILVALSMAPGHNIISITISDLGWNPNPIPEKKKLGPNLTLYEILDSNQTKSWFINFLVGFQATIRSIYSTLWWMNLIYCCCYFKFSPVKWFVNYKSFECMIHIYLVAPIECACTSIWIVLYLLNSDK